MTRTLALMLACAVLLPAAGAAQAPPPRLTLDDALTLARQYHPGLRRAQHDQHANEAATLNAWGGLMPRVTASTTFGLGSSTRLTGEDEFGRPVSLESPVTFRNSSTSQSVQANLTLFDGGRALRGVTAARAQEDAGEARIAAEERRVEAAVTRAYYQALRAERVVELEQELLASARDNLERTEALLRVAASKHADVLGARVQVAAAEQDLARAGSEVRKAKLMLLESIGIGDAADFELAGALPEPFDPAVLDVEALVASAAQHSPSVVQARAAARAASQRASVARAGRWPTLGATASFGRSMSLRSFDAFLDLNPQNRGLNFSMTMSLPVFTGFQTTAQVAQARAQEQNAREDERTASLLATREVRTAFIDLETAHRTLELARLRAELSRERLAMAEEEYRLGALSFLLLQQHIDQTAQAERGALDALHGFASALVTLEEKAAIQVGR